MGIIFFSIHKKSAELMDRKFIISRNRHHFLTELDIIYTIYTKVTFYTYTIRNYLMSENKLLLHYDLL